MVHQISYSIFEVGGEATPVMPLREKGRPRKDISAGSSSRTMFRNHMGSVTNGKKIVIDRPLLIVRILNQSVCHLGEGRTFQSQPATSVEGGCAYVHQSKPLSICIVLTVFINL
ncbi:hypothetical protein TNCV_3168711 [Trichonephila clavipes]|nr:hypothetical protein TNCV_3168711 [Trichonephila clavipes]